MDNEFNVPHAEYLFSKVKWEWCTCGCETFTPADKDSVNAYRKYHYYCSEHALIPKRPELKS